MVSGMIRPHCSASGMNTSGGTGSIVGCGQRASASTPTTDPSERDIFGWYCTPMARSRSASARSCAVGGACAASRRGVARFGRDPSAWRRSSWVTGLRSDPAIRSPIPSARREDADRTRSSSPETMITAGSHWLSRTVWNRLIPSESPSERSSRTAS